MGWIGEGIKNTKVGKRKGVQPWVHFTYQNYITSNSKIINDLISGFSYCVMEF